MMSDLNDLNPSIDKARSEDLEAVLVLQKLAYISEAEIIGDFTIAPLHQTLAEIQEEFKTQIFLVVREQGDIIGSVRAYESEATCYIGKLIVHPDCQNHGWGTRLLLDVERLFPQVRRYELFTGQKSEKNLHLYEKLGYQQFRHQVISDRLTLVFLEKVKEMS